MTVFLGSPSFHEMNVLASGSVINEYRGAGLLADLMEMIFSGIRSCFDAMNVAVAATYRFAADSGKTMVVPVVAFLGKLCAAQEFMHVPLFFRSIRAAPAFRSI